MLSGKASSVNYEVLLAIRRGRLEEVRDLLNLYGLSYIGTWSSGYVLLREALETLHKDIAELILMMGCKVNSNSKKHTNSPLHLAVRIGYLEIVEILLKRGARVDAKNDLCYTSLHVAAERGKLEIAKTLLDHNADYNSQCARGYTPLHYAVEMGNEDIVTLLLNKNSCVINAVSIHGKTPLHIAIEKGRVRIVKNLLDVGASVNFVCSSVLTNNQTYNGYTPLHFACEQDNETIVRMLLCRGADVNVNAKQNVTPLYIATKKGNRDVVKLLLEHGANVDAQDSDGKTILNIATEENNLLIVKEILKYSPNVNDNSNKNSLATAVLGYGYERKKIINALEQYGFNFNAEDANNSEVLHSAVGGGYLKIVDELLNLGADVNLSSTHKQGYTLLHNAVENNQIEIVKMLLDHGANVNAKDENSKTPLFYAIKIDNLTLTKLLICNGADLKACDELLHIAVVNKNIEIVEILLQSDIDVNVVDKSGKTPLHYICVNNLMGRNDKVCHRLQREIAILLLEKAANVNATTQDGKTALHFAIEKNNTYIVDTLLKYNADVNYFSQWDQLTPLCLAARTGSDFISLKLLSSGADVNFKQKDGMTALHIAAQKGYKKVVRVLLQFGAERDARAEGNKTPLCMAVKNGNSKTVDVLLKDGADVDLKDDCGKTALHHACKLEHAVIIKNLLQYGADINITCDKDYLPLEYAMLDDNRWYPSSRDDYLQHDFDYDDYDMGIGDCFIEDDDYSDNDDYPYPAEYSDGDNYSDRHNYSDTDSDSSESDDDYDLSPSANVILRHIVKLRTAGLFVNVKNLRLTNFGTDKMCDFQSRCSAEMKILSEEMIGNSNVSFSDILSKNTSQLIKFVKNVHVLQVFETTEWKSKFPIYADLIKSQFKRGVVRKELEELCLKFLFYIFESLPELVIEIILSYLSNDDLRNLVSVGKALNIPDM